MEKPHDPELENLREKFGKNKKIPEKYEKIILTALSHYRELKDIHIKFVTTKSYPRPYATRPTRLSVFLPPDKRHYIITILTKAEPPEKEALLKNLPEPAQVAIIGHEISHVLQFHKMSPAQLIKTIATYSLSSTRREMEREADRLTIEHGLGEELYLFAVYIRNIPGYTEKRKELNKNYLLPPEIIRYLHSEYTPHVFEKT